jgi:hypothetical protein
MGYGTILGATAKRRFLGGGVMLFRSEREDGLAQRVRTASTPTIELFSGIAADCIRLPTLIKAGKTAHIDQLLKAGAWTDAALAVIEFELPAWKVRRFIFEDGEWIVSLSRQPNLPVDLDDTADGHHECLPLAILCAFLEARRRVVTSRDNYSPIVPQIRTVAVNSICCDNFA